MRKSWPDEWLCHHAGVTVRWLNCRESQWLASVRVKQGCGEMMDLAVCTRRRRACHVQDEGPLILQMSAAQSSRVSTTLASLSASLTWLSSTNSRSGAIP